MGSTSKSHAENKAAMRQHILESAFKTFSEKTIDAINLTEVAKSAGVGPATVYRYFESKTGLVLEVNTWVWNRFIGDNHKRANLDDQSAAETYEFFLDSFIDLYRNHRDILRFNQFFNVYVHREDVTAEQLQPFNDVIAIPKQRFHDCYEKGKTDHTLRTDIPEGEIFSKTLHLMLAAVTRYAVGLVYDTGIAPEHELLFLKDLLMKAYTMPQPAGLA